MAAIDMMYTAGAWVASALFSAVLKSNLQGETGVRNPHDKGQEGMGQRHDLSGMRIEQ